MPGVSKRSSRTGKYRIWYTDEKGQRRFATGHTDKKASLDLANRLEQQARLEREGLVEVGHRQRQTAAARPVADHAEDYRLGLLAKGDDPKHAGATANAIKRLLADAGITSVAEIVPEQVQAALGRLRQKRSPRTCNHALVAVRGFVKWLAENNRIREVPRGLKSIPKFNEQLDRKRVRRALTKEDLDRLLAAAESGPPVYIYGPTRSKHHRIEIPGPERAALYRLAMATGFRADELRTLTPERFVVEGDEPSVTVLAAYSKNGKETVQPITREFAAWFRAFLDGKEPGRPVLVVPEKTAKVLRGDLAAAGIPYRDAAGRYFDFHALRHTYITHLIEKGLAPKVVQVLARHSTVTLTLDRYTHVERDNLRKAIEGEQG